MLYGVIDSAILHCMMPVQVCLILFQLDPPPQYFNVSPKYIITLINVQQQSKYFSTGKKRRFV